MKRIKGKYIAQVVIDFDVPVTSGTFPLEKIRHLVFDGDMKNAITRALNDRIGDCTVTVDQQYADVYEEEENDT